MDRWIQYWGETGGYYSKHLLLIMVQLLMIKLKNKDINVTEIVARYIPEES